MLDGFSREPNRRSSQYPQPTTFELAINLKTVKDRTHRAGQATRYQPTS